VADRHLAGTLLNEADLCASAVVANCAMNRQRQLAGVNSYTRELGFDPVEALIAILGDPHHRDASVAWLDLCCGSGRALIQAADRLADLGLTDRVDLVGVDLVDAFDPAPTADNLTLVCAPVLEWTPTRSFDLITCVHGLHYLGDKLTTLTRAASWLTTTGQLAAHLDLASVRLPDGRPAGRRLTTRLRAAGYHYDARRHRITTTGRLDVDLAYTYLGADDRAGPNYTGQPAVNSFYESNRSGSPGQGTNLG